MLNNEIVNIVVQANDKVNSNQVDNLIEDIMTSLPAKLGKNELAIKMIDPNQFVGAMRKTSLDSKGKLTVNLVKDLEKIVNVLSHSNRYHSLNTAEDCGVKQITNLQFSLDEPTKFISFSTGDKETAQIVINELVSICNIYMKQKVNKKVEDKKCLLTQKQLELSF